jgi:hypothetical protein
MNAAQRARLTMSRGYFRASGPEPRIWNPCPVCREEVSTPIGPGDMFKNGELRRPVHHRLERLLADHLGTHGTEFSD